VLRILWRRRWLLLVPLALAGGAVAIYSRTLPDRFRSETLILVVPQRVPESYVRSTVTGRIEDRLQSISQQILSRTRLEKIILDFDLYPKKRRRLPMEDVIEGMRTDVSVRVVKGDAFQVSYVGDSPHLAMRVTDRLASLFIEENLRDREVLAEGTNQFLESQLEDARRRLIEQEKKVEAYKLRNAGQLPTQLQSNLQALQNIQLQIQAIVDSSARDRDRRLAIERSIADLALNSAEPPLPQVAPVAPGATDPTALTGSTAQQLEAAKTLLSQLQTRLTPEHPDVIRMQRIIRDLEQKAEAEALHVSLSPQDPSTEGPSVQTLVRQNRINELKTELQNLDRSLAQKEADEKRLRDRASEYQMRAEAAPVRETEMIELTRDYGTIQALYSSLLAKREESKMAANLERRQVGEQFKLLDPARLPERPFTPDRFRLTLMGVVAGFIIGVALIAVLEFFDKTIRREQEAATVLGPPVLITIPMMLTDRERRGRIAVMLATNAALTVLVVGCAGVAGWTILRALRVF
jgi:polysaccharide chain length determinant protein (PEP-CTERM system associated)